MLTLNPASHLIPTPRLPQVGYMGRLVILSSGSLLTRPSSRAYVRRFVWRVLPCGHRRLSTPMPLDHVPNPCDKCTHWPVRTIPLAWFLVTTCLVTWLLTHRESAGVGHMNRFEVHIAHGFPPSSSFSSPRHQRPTDHTETVSGRG